MLSIIITVLCIAALLIFLQRMVKNELLDPMFLSALYWGMLILFSLLFSGIFGLEIKASGLIPIFLILVAFITGSMIAKHMKFGIFGRKRTGTYSHANLSNFRMGWLILIFSSMGLAAIFLQLRFLNIHIGSLSDLLHAANTISIIRYEGGTDMPKYGLVLMAFLYSAGFLGGMFAVLCRGFWNRILALLPFVVMILFTLTNGVKSGFILLFIIWASGYAGAWVWKYNGRMKKIGRLIGRLTLVLLLILALIPLTQTLRSGKVSSGTELINAGALSYFCPVNTFTIWYKTYDHTNISGFRNTLSGVNNFFFSQREVGLYGDENIVPGNYGNRPVQTNVYTMARGLIEDFSLPGAMIVLFLTGILSQFLYERTKRKSLISLGFLSLFYSILFWSMTVNIINYNTIILCWMISFTALLIIKRNNFIVQQGTEKIA